MATTVGLSRGPGVLSAAPKPVVPGAVAALGKALAPKPKAPVPGAVQALGNALLKAPRPPASTPPQPAGQSGTHAAAPATPPAAQPTGLDATYYNAALAAGHTAQSTIDGLNANIQNAHTALYGPAGTLEQLRYDQGQAVIAAQNAENAKGGFAQGALGNQIGQIGHVEHATEDADIEKFTQDSDTWNRAITAAWQGLGTDVTALGLASLQRAQAALTGPGGGASGGAASTAPAGTPGSAPAGDPTGSRPPVPVRATAERTSSHPSKPAKGTVGLASGPGVNGWQPPKPAKVGAVSALAKAMNRKK